MKKKILSLLIACCLILPFGLSLSACGKKKTEDPADQTPTTPTTAEMIEILQDSLELTNYHGEMQHVHVDKTNTEDNQTVSSTEIISTDYSVRKADGTFVYYTIENIKPDDYEGTELIKYAGYIEKDGNAWKQSEVDVDDHTNPTKTDLQRINNVGENYSQNRIVENIKNTLDYFTDIKSEETLTSDLQDILDKNLPRFQAMAGSTGDQFTYNKADIVVDSNLSYADGKYTAEGTITLPADKITHTNPTPYVKMDSFEVEFKIVYTSEMVVYSYSKFIYRMDATPSDTADALTEFYIVNEDTITKTIENTHFTKIKTIIDNYSGATLTPEDRNETVDIIVNGRAADFYHIEFGTNINEKVNTWVSTNLVENGNYTYKVYLDEDCTIEYKPDVDVKVADYNGTEVYVEITAKEGFAVVVRNYYTGTPYDGYQYDNFVFEVVEKGVYTIEYNGYNHIVLINEQQQTTPPATITLTEGEYLIDLYKTE